MDFDKEETAEKHIMFVLPQTSFLGSSLTALMSSSDHTNPPRAVFPRHPVRPQSCFRGLPKKQVSSSGTEGAYPVSWSEKSKDFSAKLTSIAILGLAMVSVGQAQFVPASERKSENDPAFTSSMMKDSPVVFPKQGCLPAKFPPDVKQVDQPTEKDYFVFSSPCRSTKQIAAIQKEMPPGTFTNPPADWTFLRNTRRILTAGGKLRLLALGDSIVNDTMRSGWVDGLQTAYPKAKIETTVYVRGGGGCQHYRQENRVEKYIVPHQPDLVLIGGISQTNTDDIREVIHQLRKALPKVEFLLATGAFGTTDPRDAAAMAAASHSGSSEYGRALRSLAAVERCAFLDITAPWVEYILSSKVHPHLFYRDSVHANETGEQILAKILLAFFAAPDHPEFAWLPQRLEWFQDLKFGFMVHWGPYSQWGCMESWPLVPEDKFGRPDDLKAWTERDKDMARFTRDYRALPKTFNPVKFDPGKWAEAAKAAGMRYVVFTTKHHDGFSMFDTKLTDYRITAADVPFHADARADVVRGVFDSFRKEGMAIGAYFSKSDWHCPNYWDPSAPTPDRNPNYDTLAQPDKWRKFVDFAHGQVAELMTGYGPIDILWLDAGQVRPPQQDLQIDRLVEMARQHQPKLIVVDRTVGGRHENYRTPEQEVPEQALPYPWETCMTMGDQWSFKPGDRYKSTHRIIHLLVDVVGKGGNFLLNIGPQPDGELPATALQRMKEVGEWMDVNGEAIHGTRSIAPYKDGQIVFTRKGAKVFAVYLTEKKGDGLPDTIHFKAFRPKAGSEVRMLGVKSALKWQVAATGGETIIEIPEAVRKSPPCHHAFALVFEPAIPGNAVTSPVDASQASAPGPATVSFNGLHRGNNLLANHQNPDDFLR